jgi:hypothetical protein
MRTIGMLATGVTAVAMLGATALMIRMLPELRRYLHIRNM